MATVSSSSRGLVGRRDQWTCHYCEKVFTKKFRCNGTVDHVKPRSAGGTNDRRNLVWSCSKCNSDKGSMHYVAFCQQIGKVPDDEVIFRQRLLEAGVALSLKAPGEVYG